MVVFDVESERDRSIEKTNPRRGSEVEFSSYPVGCVERHSEPRDESIIVQLMKARVSWNARNSRESVLKANSKRHRS